MIVSGIYIVPLTSRRVLKFPEGASIIYSVLVSIDCLHTCRNYREIN